MTQTPTSSAEGRHSNEGSPLTQNWWMTFRKKSYFQHWRSKFSSLFSYPWYISVCITHPTVEIRQAIRNCLSFPLNIYDFATPPIRGQCCLPKLEMGQYPQVRKYEIKSRWKFFKNKQFFLRKYQSCQLCQSMGMKSISHWKPKGHPIY